MISVVDEGVVYRNPHPHLRSRHTWHPSLVSLGGGRWLASFDIAEAVEAHDYATYLSRSDDDGATWSPPQPVLGAGQHDGSSSLRLGRMADGTLTLVGCLHHRRAPDDGVLNPATFGYTPSSLGFLSSTDDGATWSDLRVLEPAFEGAELETCHALVELSDGRWVLPTCTWMTWDGSAPHGMKAVLVVSEDRGETWRGGVVVADSWAERTTHFEQSLVELSDGRLVSVTWNYGVDDGRTRPTPFALASDGRTFDHHGLTGLNAQTAKLCVLPDDSMLVAYRADDAPGLRVARARLEGERWVTEESHEVWSGARGALSREQSVAAELSDLRFGYPQMVLREDGDVEMVFWCREDDLNIIRRARLRVG